VYARMLTYNDEVLWPQNLGAAAIISYTFIIDTYYSNIHK